MGGGAVSCFLQQPLIYFSSMAPKCGDLAPIGQAGVDFIRGHFPFPDVVIEGLVSSKNSHAFSY